MNDSSRQEVITFKADKALADHLKGMSNRSEFIRTALLAALEHSCPFCKGTGVLTPHRREHWDALSARLEARDCRECEAPVLIPQERERTA